MKIVYNAANSIEAHMLKNMLEQLDIPAYIQGEHLQSGAGELPISGLVKVNVDDQNVIIAKKIIKEWETQEQTISEINSISISKIAKNGTSFLKIVASFFVGAICMYFYLKPTINHHVIDINKDGIDDEKWTYEDNVVIKSEHDRNLDAKYDDVWLYKNGLRSLHKLDNNFDGKFDTEDFFENDNIFIPNPT
jgi:hypothetical protein